MCKRWMIVLLVMSLVFGPWVVGAQEENTIQLRSLTLSPMPEAREALKIRLIPRMFDLKNANAAVLYHSAAAQCPQDGEDKVFDKIDQWRDMPIEDLPRDEVTKALGQFRACFRLLELAAVRSRCEWDMPIEEGFAMLMPSLSTYRSIAFALSLKLRLEIADGQVEEALATLRSGLAMARGIAEGPTLIQDLVGIAIGAVMFRQVSEFMAMPDAPNLYWALSELPVPLISFRQSLSYEYDMMYWEIPELRDLDQKVLSGAQASALVNKMFKKFSDAGMWENKASKLLPLGWVMMHYADAKAFLADRSMEASRIDAMPTAQTVMLYQFQEFKEVRDSMFKWFSLPYAQYRVHADQYDKAADEIVQRGVKSNVFAMFLPALSRCRFLEARACRDMEMLRVIEALRLHAAANHGTFPKTLEDVTVVPVPADPVTGDSFVYVYEDSRHVRVEAPEAKEQNKKRPVFELTLRP
ncbi:MAG: hypothetical protein K9N55_07880 [Phycisphaerae bacterium]|nr:hypothetical protein [Phycisphaerae bacterium]